MDKLLLSIGIVFSSWIVAMYLNELLKKNPMYEKLSHLNFIKSDRIDLIFGIYLVKWLIKNTFFKYFNPLLKIVNRPSVSELKSLRLEMTHAEVSHLIGFVLVLLVVGYLVLVSSDIEFALMLLVVNLFMNLYPSLLQQLNKRRIDKVITIYDK